MWHQRCPLRCKNLEQPHAAMQEIASLLWWQQMSPLWQATLQRSVLRFLPTIDSNQCTFAQKIIKKQNENGAVLCTRLNSPKRTNVTNQVPICRSENRNKPHATKKERQATTRKSTKAKQTHREEVLSKNDREPCKLVKWWRRRKRKRKQWKKWKKNNGTTELGPQRKFITIYQPFYRAQGTRVNTGHIQ